MSHIERLAANVQPLHIALAHALARAKVGDAERMATLNRLFARLTPAAQMLCRAELAACREAKRGRFLAIVG